MITTAQIQKTEQDVGYQRPHLRGPVRLLIVSFTCGLIWNFIVRSLPLTHLAKELRMTPFGFGLLGGVIMYGQLAQILGSYIIERYGHRRAFVIYGGLISRVIWLPIAFLPLIGKEAWTWRLLLMGAAVSWAFSYLIMPAGMSWCADLVPLRIQGRFFGKRMQIGLYTSMAFMIVISIVLDKVVAIGDSALKIMLVCLFLFGASTGAIEYLLYILVPHPPMVKKEKKTKLSSIIWKPLADREFLCFMGCHASISWSSAFAGQFGFLFLIDVIEMKNTQITVLLTVLPNILFATLYPYWGRITDKVGYKTTLTIGAMGFFLGSWFLILATKSNWVWLYILSLGAYVLAGALETGAAVLMFSKMSSKKGDLGSSYPAVYGVIASLGGTVISVASGVVATWLGTGWHTVLCGHMFTYHTVIFSITMGMCFVAMAWLFGIKNNKNYGLRQIVIILLQQTQEDCRKLFTTKHWVQSINVLIPRTKTRATSQNEEQSRI
jgi:MFS family permease